MRVNNQNYGKAIQNTETAQTQKSGRALKGEETQGAAKVEGAESSVSAEISSKARDMAQAKAVASGAPDIREAKIEELRKRIAAKQYNVKPEDIADKMVEEHLRTSSG